jgi:RNA polymerase sigma-70 factor (ECF subfamily)
VESAQRLSQDEFIVLLAKHERRVRGFVGTLVRQSEEIDEIVQQSCLTGWKKMQDFARVEQTLDRDFARWLCTIARFEALGFVRKHRGSRLLFDTELVSKLADVQLSDERFDERREALQLCIEKLSDKQKDLVRRYYRADQSAAEIAGQDGVTRQAVFKALRLIRVALLDCVRRSMGTSGAVG